MHIGPYLLANNVFAAPMAGVTDRPFRQLCRSFGAGYAVSEMVTSRRDLWNSLKTSRRANHEGEPGPVAVQIAGTDAQMMADAAAYNIDRGAQIIDINMGCPAKKVCNVSAGSALLQDEALVARILDAVVTAVDVPVTLKIRTGPTPERRNALRIARIAEDAGIQPVTHHPARGCVTDHFREGVARLPDRHRERPPAPRGSGRGSPRDTAPSPPSAAGSRRGSPTCSARCGGGTRPQP